MCCDPIEARPTEATSRCDKCGEPVDDDGYSTLKGCNYSFPVCNGCNYRPCDQSC